MYTEQEELLLPPTKSSQVRANPRQLGKNAEQIFPWGMRQSVRGILCARNKHSAAKKTDPTVNETCASRWPHFPSALFAYVLKGGDFLLFLLCVCLLLSLPRGVRKSGCKS